MKAICPKCLEAVAVKLSVEDWQTLSCTGCDEEYTVETVRELVDGWNKLLPKLEAAGK